MKKNFLQDVIPASHKRSIRDIPLPKHRSTKSKVEQETFVPKSRSTKQTYANDPVSASSAAHSFEDKEPIFDPEQFNTVETPARATYEPEPTETFSNRGYGNDAPTKRSKGKLVPILIVLAILAGAGFFLGRTSAEVSYSAKGTTYDIDANIPVNASSSIATQIQITKTQSVTLEATSEQQVQKQASGRIKIMNLFSEDSQDLVKNTRFQTADGLVYRIKDSIKVPGYKVVNGANVAGTLEVEVYADSAGEEYNIGKTKFTIPGFSGKPQFDKITAESVTDMQGGYIGIKKVVSEDAEDDAYDELKAKLEAEFGTNVTISENQVVVADTETVIFGELMDEVTGNSVKLTLSATANAYQFDKMTLSDYIGRNTVVGSTAQDRFEIDPAQLTFTKDSDTVIATGSADIRWITDIEALKQEIAGKKRTEIVQIISSHQSMEKAEVRLDPFWKTRFPSDPTKISVALTE